METYELVPDFSVNFAGGIRNADQAKWNPKRTMVRFNYRHRRAYNNTDGAFSVSPTGSLDDQWGPAGGDTRHRLRASVSTQALAQPQRADELGCQQRRAVHDHHRHRRKRRFDLQRSPVRRPRNSVRLPWRSTLSANVSYTIPIGRAPALKRASRRGRTAGSPAVVAAARRWRWPRGGGGRQKGITFNVSAQNMMNRYELLGLQRRADVAVFPAGDERLESAPGRHLGPLQFLGPDRPGRHNRSSFMRIIVLGAGAIGSTYGAKLSRHHDVTLIGGAAHVAAIQRDGLVMQGQLPARCGCRRSRPFLRSIPAR